MISKGNHVKFARFVFPAVSYFRDNFFRSVYNKTIIIFGFCDIQNNQGLDITKTSSNNCLESE